jgi:hypothetical protein
MQFSFLRGSFLALPKDPERPSRSPPRSIELSLAPTILLAGVIQNGKNASLAAWLQRSGQEKANTRTWKRNSASRRPERSANAKYATMRSFHDFRFTVALLPAVNEQTERPDARPDEQNRRNRPRPITEYSERILNYKYSCEKEFPFLSKDRLVLPAKL